MKFLKEKKDISMPAVRLRNARFVVIDTELTGLDEKHDAIISIGAVRMEGGRIELSDTFYRLANPKRRFEPRSVIIHEITPSEVMEAPGIDLVLAEFLEYCGNDILVGYCVDIDLHFINKEMTRIYGLSLTNPIVDISYIYEWLKKREIGRQKDEQSLPILSEGKLYNIAAAYGISLNGAHNAMVDAFVTSQVFQRFVPLLIKKGIETVGDLMKIGRLYKGGDTFSTALEKSSY